MKDIDKFTKGEMDENQEKNYLESLYKEHYDRKLKSIYSEKLGESYSVFRSSTSDSKPSSKSFRRFIILGISGIAAAVLIIFALPMLQKSNSQDATTFAQNLISIEEIDVKRGQQIDSQLQLDIVEAYNSANYDKVLKLFEQLEEPTDENRYYLGRLLLYQNKYKDAIATFEQIENRNNFKYRIELAYWLGIAYISNGNNDAARPLLKEVSESKWNSSNVNALLDKIKL